MIVDDCELGGLLLYFFLLKAYSPVIRTESPQGFSRVQINVAQVEYNTKHAHYINVTIYKHNPKVRPFGNALGGKKRQIKLADAGTIDRVGLAFQYQIIFFINGQKQLQIKHTI